MFSDWTDAVHNFYSQPWKPKWPLSGCYQKPEEHKVKSFYHTWPGQWRWRFPAWVVSGREAFIGGMGFKEKFSAPFLLEGSHVQSNRTQMVSKAVTLPEMIWTQLYFTWLISQDMTWIFDFSVDRELLSVIITKLSHASIRHLSLDQQRDRSSFRRWWWWWYRTPTM